jgi:hypothetical protein
MNIVQFDEDVNADHLEEACREEGKVVPYRFPRRFRGNRTPDKQVIGDLLLAKGNLLLSGDLEFASRWIKHIPDAHAGIVMIGPETPIDSFGTHEVQEILARLKAGLEDWNTIAWNNSIVTVRPDRLEVQHAQAHALISDDLLYRSSPGWALRFKALLHANASRTSSP